MADCFKMKCVIGNNTYTIDLLDGIIDFSKDTEVNYYYNVETLDGNKHYKIRSYFTNISVTVGDKLYPSTQNTYIEKFNEFYDHYLSISGLEDYCAVQLDTTENYKKCTIEKDTARINRMVNSKFWFDTMSFNIQCTESGDI